MQKFSMRIGRAFRFSMIFRLLYVNLAIVLLFSIGGAVFALSGSDDILYRREREACADVVDSFYDFAFDRYYSVYNIDHFAYTGSGIVNMLRNVARDPELAHSSAVVETIHNFSRAACLQDKDIYDLIVISDGGYIYPYSPNTLKHSVLQSFSYIDYAPIASFLASEDKTRVFYDPAPPYTTRNQESVISFVRKLYHPTTVGKSEPVGLLLINFRYADFVAYAKKLIGGGNGTLLIYDDSQKIIFISDEAQPCVSADEYFSGQGEKTLIAKQRLGISGLCIAGCISESEMFREIRKLWQTQILILLGSAFICVAITTLIYRLYNRRVHLLVATMGASDITKRAEIKGNDELNLIADAYNDMCDRLERQIELEYNAQLKLRTSQLKQLTAQINPHFIYNTLESIRMQSLLEGGEKTAEMLVLFSEMFRWAVRGNSGIVPLEEEVNYIRKYLQLYSHRLNGQLEYAVDLPDDLLDLGIPKLILQPLVENAFAHGHFDELIESGRQPSISIHGENHAGTMEISVKDNGRGMTEEQMIRLSRILSEEVTEAGHESIGCKNVHERLRLYFGKEYGLSVIRDCGSGTKMIIRLPAMNYEELRNVQADDNR